eukprot:m.147484 g.147484  ORF g.147484 m.147484 type:complete len:257 (+) comp14182_c0_seq4:2240-3010(+)
MVNDKQGFDISHRHFSHLFHVYPLKLEDPKSALATTSLDRWTGLTCGSVGGCPNGFTFDGAASMSGMAGRQDDAAAFMIGFLLSGKVHMSTMYSEGSSPCIESPLAAANSLQEFMLDSWGGRVKLFAGLPSNWPEAVIGNMLAEGGFELSARRQAGKTHFVQVKSTGSGRSFICDSDMIGTLECYPPFAGFIDHRNGSFELHGLAAGDTVVIALASTSTKSFVIDPLPGDPAEHNYWGTPKNQDDNVVECRRAYNL